MTPEELKSLRKSLKLTQEEMAEKLGIKTRMYSYVEKGHKPMRTPSAILAHQLAEKVALTRHPE